MNFDDIKHKTLSDLYDLSIEELYLIFKQRYEEELAEIQLKQWGKD